jgi:hypothetical protein
MLFILETTWGAGYREHRLCERALGTFGTACTVGIVTMELRLTDLFLDVFEFVLKSRKLLKTSSEFFSHFGVHSMGAVAAR